MPSLLDRLTDHDPDVSTEPKWRQSQSVADYYESVLRDVEALLNTRRTELNELPAESELNRSVLCYGLPEYSASLVSSKDDRERIRLAVEATIKWFEPRMVDVRVTLHPSEGQSDQTLRMTVDAVLWMQPDPLHVTFDTVMKPAQGTCSVESS